MSKRRRKDSEDRHGDHSRSSRATPSLSIMGNMGNARRNRRQSDDRDGKARQRRKGHDSDSSSGGGRKGLRMQDSDSDNKNNNDRGRGLRVVQDSDSDERKLSDSDSSNRRRRDSSSSDDRRGRRHSSSSDGKQQNSSDEESESSSVGLNVLERSKRNVPNMQSQREKSKKEVEDENEFWNYLIPELGATSEQDEDNSSDSEKDSEKSEESAEKSDGSDDDALNDSDQDGSEQASDDNEGNQDDEEASGSGKRPMKRKPSAKKGRREKRRSNESDSNSDSDGSSSSSFLKADIDVNEKLDENVASDSGSEDEQTKKKKAAVARAGKQVYMDPYDKKNEMKKKIITLIKRPTRKPQKRTQTEKLIDAKDREDAIIRQREEEAILHKRKLEEEQMAATAARLRNKIGVSGKPMSTIQLKRWEQRQMYRHLVGTVVHTRMLKTVPANIVTQSKTNTATGSSEKKVSSTDDDFSMICNTALIRRSENVRAETKGSSVSQNSFTRSPSQCKRCCEEFRYHGVVDPFNAIHKQYNGIPNLEMREREKQRAAAIKEEQRTLRAMFLQQEEDSYSDLSDSD